MKCSFCGVTMEAGTGKLFVRKSGKVLYFCRGKCERNMLTLNRKARSTPWTREYKQVKSAVKK